MRSRNGLTRPQSHSRATSKGHRKSQARFRLAENDWKSSPKQPRFQLYVRILFPMLLRELRELASFSVKSDLSSYFIYSYVIRYFEFSVTLTGFSQVIINLNPTWKIQQKYCVEVEQISQNLRRTFVRDEKQGNCFTMLH